MGQGGAIARRTHADLEQEREYLGARVSSAFGQGEVLLGPRQIAGRHGLDAARVQLGRGQDRRGRMRRFDRQVGAARAR